MLLLLCKGGKGLNNTIISKATLGRIPSYIRCMKNMPEKVNYISSTSISKELGLGEVQVRKDLGLLSGKGKPKTGYDKLDLINCLESYIKNDNGNAIIIGAGKLGQALLDYDGFHDFGLNIIAAFDNALFKENITTTKHRILPLDKLDEFVKSNNIKIGIITVPKESAQSAFNTLYNSGIRVFWCFSLVRLYKPVDAIIQYENLELSLAHLKMQINMEKGDI